MSAFFFYPFYIFPITLTFSSILKAFLVLCMTVAMLYVTSVQSTAGVEMQESLYAQSELPFL
jgi:hypothetical protein